MTVTIRPERIAIATDGDAGQYDCRASGTVRDSLYAGPITRFVVGSTAAVSWWSSARTPAQASRTPEALRDSRVTLVWRRDYTRVISKTEERRTDETKSVDQA